MNRKAKLVVLILCTACFVTVWRISTLRHYFVAPEIKEEVKNNSKSCSCATCIADFGEFFRKRYDKNVDLFLTPLSNLVEADYNWWRTLQAEKGDINKFTETKMRLFTLFPSKPDVTEPSPDRCRTCAVVGNSGNLKGSKYGSKIDMNDIVIRMNEGRTAGYEEDVGSKTTHRVMYPESATNLDNSTHLVLFPFKILDIRWVMDAFTTGFHGSSYAPVLGKIKANKNLVMVVNPGFMKYVHRSWLFNVGKYPSTGFMTLVLAMHICDEVKIFGFGADKNGSWYHYWEPPKKNFKTGLHPGSYEYKQIEELVKENNMSFFKGN